MWSPLAAEHRMNSAEKLADAMYSGSAILFPEMKQIANIGFAESRIRPAFWFWHDH
jgi:hypothetical protein